QKFPTGSSSKPRQRRLPSARYHLAAALKTHQPRTLRRESTPSPVTSLWHLSPPSKRSASNSLRSVLDREKPCLQKYSPACTAPQTPSLSERRSRPLRASALSSATRPRAVPRREFPEMSAPRPAFFLPPRLGPSSLAAAQPAARSQKMKCWQK